MKPAALPLGQQLIARGLVSEDQLRIALMEQDRSKLPLGKLLVRLGFVSEAALRDALGEVQGHRTVDLAHTLADHEALALVPQDLARRHRLLALSWQPEARRITVAMADSNDLLAMDQLRARLPAGTQVEALIAGESDIARAIDRYYGFDLSLDGILTEIETGRADPRLAAAAATEYSQPVVRLVDALLSDAVKRGASDLHFEPEESFLRIRLRIDGILHQVRALHQSYWPAMAVRVKVMAGLNIAETRAPQDGRITLNTNGRLIDYRVSVQPTLHGENIVLRILDRERGILKLDGLGLADAQLDTLKLMLARPSGIILVTGPTGSGKTTTLYSVLSAISSESINVMTLEDPVEYPLPLIRQTSVADAVKLDFANGIRSIMRQDPDVILVGEIRDADTAQMAFRAAMTGHQVFSTLHTNSALGAIPRLLDLGILPDILAGNVVGVIGQRLLRRLCVECRQPHAPDAAELQLLGWREDRPAPALFRAKGCTHCAHQGYRGRLAIMEIMRLDADIDDLIARRALPRELRAAARAKGFRSLADDGLRRVLDGSTSLAELSRVVDLTDRMPAASADWAA
ncbi:MAG: type II/IV secretion system protein [Rhodocyclaceae bacterium]|nr:type II/IV secretion system protein [Rhodocyclaceae bacterium]